MGTSFQHDGADPHRRLRQLEEEIRASGDALADTVEALQLRFHPQQIASRTKEHLKEWGRTQMIEAGHRARFVADVAGVRRHPLAAATVALTAGLFIARRVLRRSAPP